MSNLMFHDHGTNISSPLNVLVLGPDCRLNQSFIEQIDNQVDGFSEHARWGNFDHDEVFEWMQRGVYTHIFYVEPDSDDAANYNVPCDPFMMILVDGGKDYFKKEIENCIDLMQLERMN